MTEHSIDPPSFDPSLEGRLRPSGALGRLLCRMAGADPQLLTLAPWSDRLKSLATGALLLFIWALNWISLSYALMLVFRPEDAVGSLNSVVSRILCVLLGLAWSMIVLNLFRFLTSAVGHGDGRQGIRGREYMLLGVQIALSAMVGLCVTAPVSIMIARSDLKSQVSDSQERALESLLREVEVEYRKPLQDLYLDKAEASEALTQAQERSQRVKRVSQAMVVRSRAAAATPANKPEIDARINAQEVQSLQERIEALSARIEAIRETIAERKQAARELIARSNSLWTEVDRIWRHSAPLMVGLALVLISLHVGPCLLGVSSAVGAYGHLVQLQNELVCAKYGIARRASELTMPDGLGGRYVKRRFDRFSMPEALARRTADDAYRLRQAWAEAHTARAEAERRRIVST